MADQANGLVLLRLQAQPTSHPTEDGEMLWRCLVCSERLESGVSSREVGSSSLRLPVSRTLSPVTAVDSGRAWLRPQRNLAVRMPCEDALIGSHNLAWAWDA